MPTDLKIKNKLKKKKEKNRSLLKLLKPPWFSRCREKKKNMLSSQAALRGRQVAHFLTSMISVLQRWLPVSLNQYYNSLEVLTVIQVQILKEKNVLR